MNSDSGRVWVLPVRILAIRTDLTSEMGARLVTYLDRGGRLAGPRWDGSWALFRKNEWEVAGLASGEVGFLA
jgi:hypothetical protein